MKQLAVIAALLLQSLSTLADDVITNVMSRVVSYQFQENLSGSEITSPIVSYHYFNKLGESGTQPSHRFAKKLKKKAGRKVLATPHSVG